MKRNAFGQLGVSSASHFYRPFLRYFAPVDGEGGDGDGEGGDGGSGDGGSEFTPPSSQEELDRIIASRVARAERSAREDERRKLTQEPKPKGDGEGKANAHEGAVSGDDVDKRINEALAAERLELALERVNDGLDKALEGRTYAASKLFNLDRKQFVKEDGKTVDTGALKKWVDENSKEIESTDSKGRRPIPGQGSRDANATGGSVSSGRDLYHETHKKKSSGKD